MVDERIASENHPSSANPEALDREYGGPAVQHPGTPQTSLAMASALPRTAGMSAEAAAAEHSRCMADPAFLARLNNAGGKKAALDHLEALSAARFGKPAAAAQKPATAPQGADGKPLSQEEARAADALARHQHELADPEELKAFDAACEPKLPGEFHALGKAEHKQLLFQHGVAPAIANFLAAQAPAVSAMSDDQWRAATDKASDLVMKRPDGKRIIADAQRYIDSMGDNHPLARAAELAAAFAPGIVELARLGRRERTAAN